LKCIDFAERPSVAWVNRLVDLATAALSALTDESGVCRFFVCPESVVPRWIVVALEFMAVS
jgi:hypothetical protein